MPASQPAIGRFGTIAVVACVLYPLLGGLLGCGTEANSNTEVAGGGGPATAVVVALPTRHEFADRIEALGTALANESVVITVQVTETVRRVAFHDGRTVETGQVLVELTSEEESAQLAEAQANHADATLRFRRIADLAKQGTESQSRLDEVSAARDAAEARLHEIQARISDRLIRAPFGGVLGLREVSPGTLLQPGDRITTLDDIDVIKVDFSVPEAFLAALQRGLEIESESAAYPGRRFAGTLTAIDTRIDPGTRAVRARAEIPNADHALRPGMLLTIVLYANPSESIALPEQALVPQGDKQFVVLVDGEHGRRVEVRIGRRVPGLVEILSGISLDDLVVVDGSSRVRPGGRVKIVRRSAPPGA